LTCGGFDLLNERGLAVAGIAGQDHQTILFGKDCRSKLAIQLRRDIGTAGEFVFQPPRQAIARFRLALEHQELIEEGIVGYGIVVLRKVAQTPLPASGTTWMIRLMLASPPSVGTNFRRQILASLSRVVIPKAYRGIWECKSKESLILLPQKPSRKEPEKRNVFSANG
jgi:hypothetical protein